MVANFSDPSNGEKVVEESFVKYANLRYCTKIMTSLLYIM